MGTLMMIKTIKEIHPKDLLLVKMGDFYHTYGKDSYILSYLMGYNLRILEKNCPSCGFPSKSLAKIESILEDKKINYLIIDRRNNYDVEEFIDNKNLNTYEESYKKAHRYIGLKKRIDNIQEKLMQQINTENVKDKIIEMEKILET